MTISRHFNSIVWERPAFVLAALLPAVVVPHLLDFGYWPADFEVVAIGLGASGLGLALSVVERMAPRIANLIIAIGIYWLVDVYFDDRGFVSAGALLVAFFALKSPYRDDVCRAVLVFSCVWLIMNLAQPAKPLLESAVAPLDRSAPRPDLPPIVHIVLDEQMSPEAWPETIPSGSGARAILDQYLDRGFLVYADSRSVSSATKIALGRLVELAGNASSAGERMPAGNLVSASKLGAFSIKSNRYFDRLHDLGYAITAYQSTYLNFCPSRLLAGDECHTYSHYGHGHSMSMRLGTIAARLSFAFDILDYEYQRAGYIGRSVVIYAFWKRLLSAQSISGAQSRTMMALSIAQILDDRFRRIEPGRMYFAHLLLPHSPYILDEDCQVTDFSQWFAVDVPWRHVDVYPAYWAQAVCTGKLVAALIDNAEASSIAPPIVIVHGDHGARITLHDPETRASPDQRDMLATFLAVKMPGLRPGKITAPVELQSTFAKLMVDWMGRDGQ